MPTKEQHALSRMHSQVQVNHEIRVYVLGDTCGRVENEMKFCKLFACFAINSVQYSKSVFP